MEKIESFTFVKEFLKQRQIVFTFIAKVKTFFYQKDKNITVSSANLHYVISLKEFEELFGKETFYLYNENQAGIDEEKDDAYYAWKARSIN